MEGDVLGDVVGGPVGATLTEGAVDAEGEALGDVLACLVGDTLNEGAEVGLILGDRVGQVLG